MAENKDSRLGIRVKGWARFQHYKDRAPAWIKLHRNLLDDYDWHRLPDASKALAPMLWLLASETEAGEINLTLDEVAFRLRTTPEKINAALKPLISAGFFIVEQGDSAPLAGGYQDACSEEEREKEEEREEEKREIAATSAARPPLTEAVEVYNAEAEKAGWAKVQRLTDVRRAALKARLAECGGLEGWQTAMAKAGGSKFLTGKVPRGKGHENWRPDFDFFLKATNFTKLMEGTYDDRTGAADSQRTDIYADFAAAADLLRDKQYHGI